MRASPAAVVLGSAFADGASLGHLVAEDINTSQGAVRVWRHTDTGGVVMFRHGRPHRWLPHQVPWRAQALALRAVGARAVLLTSSVGVLDPTVPLYTPHIAGDLVMVDNRLPDGSACTIWPHPTPDQAHLVLRDGLFSSALGAWMTGRFAMPERRLRFAYVPGPRTKTAAENVLLASQGIQVNSMSIGPEVVLANELELPTAAVLVGHKASAADGPDATAVTASLSRSRAATRAIALGFLADAPSVPFANLLYRFGAHDS